MIFFSTISFWGSINEILRKECPRRKAPGAACDLWLCYGFKFAKHSKCTRGLTGRLQQDSWEVVTPSIKKLHGLALSLTLGKCDFKEGERMPAMLGSSCCGVRMEQGRMELRVHPQKIILGFFHKDQWHLG